MPARIKGNALSRKAAVEFLPGSDELFVVDSSVSVLEGSSVEDADLLSSFVVSLSDEDSFVGFSVGASVESGSMVIGSFVDGSTVGPIFSAWQISQV